MSDLRNESSRDPRQEMEEVVAWSLQLDSHSCTACDEYGRCPACLDRHTYDDRSDRDKYIRAFNRLEKAVTNHIKDRCLDSDDLAHVHAAVMRDLTEKLR